MMYALLFLLDASFWRMTDIEVHATSVLGFANLWEELVGNGRAAVGCTVVTRYQ